jgi:hypothetical protein
VSSRHDPQSGGVRRNTVAGDSSPRHIGLAVKKAESRPARGYFVLDFPFHRTFAPLRGAKHLGGVTVACCDPRFL